jgi:hypothetical protein
MYASTRDQFTDRCLRKLGYPVIEINVDEDQVADRVDDAIQKYWDFHFDGIEKLFMKHQITAADIANTAVPLDDSIIGVKRVLPLHGGGGLGSNISMFDVRYQYMLNELPEFTSLSYMDYEITMMHLEQLNFFFGSQPGLAFNRHQNKIVIHTDWQYDLIEGSWIVIECYKALDQDTYTDMWKDPWLFSYATALIKQQWGTNLSKFNGIGLPGGITMNGAQLYLDASTEIATLEAVLRDTYEEPPGFIMG